jgi:putative aminopeptidase FrvX
MTEESLVVSGDVGNRGALMVERAISKKMLIAKGTVIAKKNIELIRYEKIYRHKGTRRSVDL